MTKLDYDINDRVETAAIHIHENSGYWPSAFDLAMALVEDDVARGEYTADDLSLIEIAASEYVAVAERIGL